MNLLVTGSSGFIGSHIITLGTACGFSVTALHRNSCQRKPKTTMNNLKYLKKDIMDLAPHDFTNLDAVIHLAGSGVSPQRASNKDMTDTNVLAMLRVLELAKSQKVCRIVIAGSSHEYGLSANDFRYIPPKAPLMPITMYAATKAAGFSIAHAFAITEKLELFYGRLFNVYGTGQFKGNFWPSLVSAARSGRDFMMTSGRLVTDFSAVKDVAAQLLYACVRSDIEPGIPMIQNIGSGNIISLEEFARNEWANLAAKGRLLVGAIPDRDDQIYRIAPLLDPLPPVGLDAFLIR